MSTIQEALAVVRTAEEQLRNLMQVALKQKDYEAVGGLARIANDLSDVALRIGEPSGAIMTASSTTATSTAPKLKKPRAQRSKKTPAKGAGSKYPQFARDGERLVKVGWSKKRREEYEHRAPKGAVVALARHLASTIPAGNVFAIEDIAPVEDGAGNEIPSYQIYLTLAWFRGAGVVEKKGRDGHSLIEGSLSNGAIDALWAALPLREAIK
jgi:hypothetical protein